MKMSSRRRDVLAQMQKCPNGAFTTKDLGVIHKTMHILVVNGLVTAREVSPFAKLSSDGILWELTDKGKQEGGSMTTHEIPGQHRDMPAAIAASATAARSTTTASAPTRAASATAPRRTGS